MRRLSMGTRDELLSALVARYGQAGRGDKGQILTEFARVTGYHRKHSAGLLRGGRMSMTVEAAKLPTLLSALRLPTFGLTAALAGCLRCVS